MNFIRRWKASWSSCSMHPHFVLPVNWAGLIGMIAMCRCLALMSLSAMLGLLSLEPSAVILLAWLNFFSGTFTNLPSLSATSWQLKTARPHLLSCRSLLWTALSNQSSWVPSSAHKCPQAILMPHPFILRDYCAHREHFFPALYFFWFPMYLVYLLDIVQARLWPCLSSTDRASCLLLTALLGPWNVASGQCFCVALPPAPES